MSFRHLMIPALALTLGVAPVFASAAARTSAPMGEAEGLSGGSTLPLILSLAAFAAVVAVVVLDEGEDEPASP